MAANNTEIIAPSPEHLELITEASEQLKAAEDALLRKVGDADTWDAQDLLEQVRNGIPHEYYVIAFWNLVDRGDIVLDDELVVSKNTEDELAISAQ